MSNTKFTPGPWSIDISGKNAKFPIYRVIAGENGKGSEVALVFTAMQDLKDDAEANAKLIAAAPDTHESNVFMTDKVKQCIEVVRRYIIPDGISPEQAISELIGLLDNAEIVQKLSASEAAINKATS